RGAPGPRQPLQPHEPAPRRGAGRKTPSFYSKSRRGRPMKLIRFFVRCSRNIPYSKRLITFVIVTGLLGGISNTIVLVVINKALHGNLSVDSSLTWFFAAMCLVAAANKACSQILLVRFYSGTIFNLRIQLSRQILKAPLRHLERIGLNRLLTTFTEDTM